MIILRLVILISETVPIISELLSRTLIVHSQLQKPIPSQFSIVEQLMYGKKSHQLLMQGHIVAIIMHSILMQTIVLLH